MDGQPHVCVPTCRVRQTRSATFVGLRLSARRGRASHSCTPKSCCPGLVALVAAMASSRAPRGPTATFGAEESAFKPHSKSAAVDVSEAASSGTKQTLLKALSAHLKATYRKVDPSQPVGNDAAPRRVLTHPSFPVSNGCACFPPTMQESQAAGDRVQRSHTRDDARATI